jgi:DNA mismatch repair protein MutS
VARLAGVPRALLEAAESKLRGLESGKAAPGGLRPVEPALGADACAEGRGEGPVQLSMFSLAPNPVVERLKSLDLMEMTPSKAFLALEELKAAADAEGGGAWAGN